MTQLKILGGDLRAGTHKLRRSLTGKPVFKIPYGFLGTLNLHKELESVDLQSQESARSIAKTLGWSGVGAILAGPLGALLGAYAGGQIREVFFLAKLKDGRQFLGTTDPKTYQHLKVISL